MLPQVGSRWFSLALLAATVLMVLAVLAGAAGTADAGSPSEQRKFKTRVNGEFKAMALATGVSVPSSAGFGETAFAAHKCDFSFFSAGSPASPGVQALAEDGSISAFETAVDAAVSDGNAQEFWKIDPPNGPGKGKGGPDIQIKEDFSCLTVLVKINPTSDWFSGVSAHDLRAGGTWPTPGNNNNIFIDLFPFDAGTLDGTEFAASTVATSPQGTITSLRNTGKFSNSKIAQLKLTMKNPALTKDVTAVEAIESIIVTWGEVVAAGGYHVMWKSGAEAYDTDGSLGRRDVVVGGKTKTHTIIGLTGGVEYDVQVIAYNEAGQSSQTPTYESRATATAIGVNNTVLVGNSTQLLPGTERLTIGTAIPDRARAQAFTTGSEPAVLGSVTLPDFRKENNNSVVDVHIYSASGVDPDAELHTLTRPDFTSFSSRVPTDITFRAAAADTITLAINTTYFVVVESVQAEVGLAHTKDDDEDPASDEGWSIANTCRREHGDGTPNSDCERTGSSTAALIMVLNSPLEAGRPVLSISGSEAVEGTGIQFTVSLSPALGEEVTVEYSTADDTATTADSDYTAVSAATLTFAANETEKTVTIATTADSTDEDDESFNVVLSSPSENAQLGYVTSASGLIINNDQTTQTDGTLSSITLAGSDGNTIALTPTFGQYKFLYTATADSEIDSLTGVVVPSTTGTLQSIMYVGGSEDTVTTAYDAVWPLVPGDNLIKFMVTSPDGSRTKIYKIHVNKDAATDATLSDLTLVDNNGTAITLSPAFNSATTEYTASAGAAVSSVTLTGTQNYSGATMSNNLGPDVTSGEATVGPWAGESVINIDLTAEDGATTKRYTVTAERTLQISFGSAAYSVDEGDLVQVSVSLDGVPGNEVRANLSRTLQGAITADFGGVPEYVTFAGTDAVATFDFVARTDIPSDPGESVTIGLSPNSQFPGLQTGSTAETVVSIGEIVTDQLVAVDFGQSTYSVNEGASVPITITLATAPSSSVTIPLTITAEGDAISPDYSVPSSVTFDSGDTSQTITFSATLDADTDPGESVKIELGTLPMGYAAGATTETRVSINNLSVLVNFGAASYDVKENEEVEITVTLSPAVGSDVAIGIMAVGRGGATPADYTLPTPTSVTFLAGDTEKTITFTPVNDTDDDDGEFVNIEFDLDALPAGVFVGTTVVETTVNIEDNDHPTIGLGFSQGTYSVTEGEYMDLTLLLTAPPKRVIEIVMQVIPQGNTLLADYTAAPTNISFDANATTATLRFTAIDDSFCDDGESVKFEPDLFLPGGVRLGDNFIAIVTIIDNDCPGVSISESSLAIAEGNTDTYTVALNSQPMGDVTVTIAGAGTDLSLDNTTLTFTTTTWASAQTVTVSAVDDEIDDDGETVTLTHTVASADDSDYQGISARRVAVSITDNDGTGVTVSETALTVTEEDTTGDSYTVVLNTQPTASVTVTVEGFSSSDVTANPASLTFTTLNWDTPQTVTVTAANDADTANDTVTLTHSAASTDTNYDGITIASVTVTVNDTDTDTATVTRGGSGGGGGARSNRSPSFTEGATTDRSIAENTPAGANIGDPVAASDRDDDTLTYSLRGSDAESFDIDASSGQLLTKAALDYETEANYSVNVAVSDSKTSSGGASNRNDEDITVTINVENVDEPGLVALSLSEPDVGVELTAALTDPDGGVERVVWSWERSADQTAWTAISGAASAAYTPVVADKGSYLRATASYTDGHGPRKSARAATSSPVPSNTAPVFLDAHSDKLELSVAENTNAGEAVGAPVAATDAEDDALTYALGGADAALFVIDAGTGQITVGSGTTLDYEADKKVYEVTVTVLDSSGASETITVTITVINVDLGRYDADGNEAIDWDEAVAAVVDYFADRITKEEAIEVLQLYSAG